MNQTDCPESPSGNSGLAHPPNLPLPLSIVVVVAAAVAVVVIVVLVLVVVLVVVIVVLLLLLLLLPPPLLLLLLLQKDLGVTESPACGLIKKVREGPSSHVIIQKGRRRQRQ